MAKMSVGAAQEDLPGAVARAQSEAVALEQEGQTVAVIISAARFAQVIAALEDAEPSRRVR
jgi:PHD/YefM family antitoxin component YafN of YafNO toxin-antitoxin module